ncbi:uncharacterized protein LOC123510725 [Portunus trituberculatus]|uniref:uncharacterized protein LOC123510725 n=1 Tax=Portunus trituberculatus TaxID=210409 RepID=UPI001E1CD28B|nr:uncharacterized protein LOC123510725 [Portunus trituberculatus]
MEEAAAPGQAQGSPTCPVCHVRYANFGGRRVHERAAHPESFYAARLRSRTKARWDPEEVHLMAAFERLHSGERGLNEQIHELVLPHRTLEAIKGKRRQAGYKALLVAEVVPAADPLPIPAPEADSGPTSEPQQPLSPPASQSLSQRERATSIVELPPPEEDLRLAIQREMETLSSILGVEVPRDTTDVQRQLEDWSPSPLGSPKTREEPKGSEGH